MAIRSALLLGLLVWLVPFLVAFAAFPLKAQWRSLFESLMAVTVAASVVACGLVYLRGRPAATVREGLLVGLVWLAICVAIDLPLMLSPPISYSPTEYAADIGLTYVMIPLITAGLAAASGTGSRRNL